MLPVITHPGAPAFTPYQSGKASQMTRAANNATAAGTGTVLLSLIAVSLSGCAPTPPPASDGKPGPHEITVTATDRECTLSKPSTLTGRTDFIVTNTGTKVTEFYLYGAGNQVLGDVHNIQPGQQRSLSLALDEPGYYFTACKPALIGDGISADFKVEGNPIAPDRQDQTGQRYRRYVTNQTGALVTATAALVGAVKKGDVTGAQDLYPLARTYYERIAPVAQWFPNNLQARIDQGQVEGRPDERWSGFHRLEKDLWLSGLQPDTNAVANQLLADVKELDSGLTNPKWVVGSDDVVRGAQNVLANLAKDAGTGNGELYSHTDLWDFQAGADGCRVAVGSVRSAVDERDPELGKRIDQAFATVQGLLDRLQWNGGFGFGPYDRVAEPQRQELSRAMDAANIEIGQLSSTAAPR